MAANTNKRIAIKWIRDKAKSAYDKKDECFICDDTQELELHHTHGLTNLLERWAKAEGVSLNTDDEVINVRERFIEEHHKEIYDDVYTLCARHHGNLHKIFGKSPLLHTASKQEVWIIKQKDKHNGIQSNELFQNESKPRPRADSTSGGFFSKFINSTNSNASFRTLGISK